MTGKSATLEAAEQLEGNAEPCDQLETRPELAELVRTSPELAEQLETWSTPAVQLEDQAEAQLEDQAETAAELRAISGGEGVDPSVFEPDASDVLDDSPISLALARGARNLLAQEIVTRWAVAGPPIPAKIRALGLMKSSRLPLFAAPADVLEVLGRIPGVGGLFVCREEPAE